MINDDFYLINHLRASERNNFSHYTSLSSFLKITLSKSFRLTQLSHVNDKEEENRLNAIKKNKVFVACFNHNVNESLDLWNTYGKSRDGIKITIKNLDIFNEVERYFYFYEENIIRFPDTSWEIRDTKILDVEYVSEPYDYYENDDPLDNGSKIPFQLHGGILKREKWRNESETRVRVYIDRNKEGTLRSIKSKIRLPNNPNLDYIYFDLDKEFFSSLCITINPYCAEDEKESIRKQIIESYPFCLNPNINDSTICVPR